MITANTVQSIKFGSKITIFNGIYAILLGIVYLGFSKLILLENFRVIDVVWQVFSKYNPSISWMLVKLMIIKGVFIITLGIVIVYLSTYILKRKDKPTWIMLFIIGLIFWPSMLAFEILDKNWYTTAAFLLGWISFIVGMLIPVKYYLQKDYQEY